jgi:signal transduction histidine kinase
MLTVETSGGVLVHAALLAMAILLLAVVRLADRRTAPGTGRRWRNASLASVAMLGIALVAAILLAWGGASRLLAAALAWYAALLAWVLLLTLICLPALNGPRRIGFFALIALVTVVAFAYLLAAWTMPPPVGSLAPAAPIWLVLLTSATVMIVSGIALVLLYRRRPEGWALPVLAAGILAAGAAVDLAFSPAAWPTGPMGTLAALIFFPVVTLYYLDSTFPVAAPRKSSGASPSPAETLTAAVDFASWMQLTTANELGEAVVKSTANAVRVEFVMLLTPPDERGLFAAARGYDHIREQSLQGFGMTGRRYPALQEALVERRVLQVTDEPKPADLDSLMDEVEAYESGTLLMVPILGGNALLGGLLLYSPFAQKRWSEQEVRQLEKLCSLLATRLAELHASAPAADESPPQEEAQAPGRPGAHAWTELSANQGPASEELSLVLQELAEARAQLAQAAVGERPLTELDQQAPLLGSLAARLEQSLRAASSYTSLLLDDVAGELTSVQRKYLDRIQGAQARMQETAQVLREHLAPESDQASDGADFADLEAIVQEVMSRYKPVMREHDLRLQLELPDRSLTIQADAGTLEQMLDNLIANAVGVTPDGEEVALSAHAIRDGGKSYVLLAVLDRGEGIPTDQLGLVFEPHTASRTQRPPGIKDGGVGLPLAKRLCEAMGGRMWVDSHLGHGTTYTALLPLRPQEEGTSTAAMTSWS